MKTLSLIVAATLVVIGYISFNAYMRAAHAIVHLTHPHL